MGPGLAAVVAPIVAVFTSPAAALGVAIGAVLIQGIKNAVVVPRVMEQVIGISPLATIFGVLAGAQLLGPLGALLAVPVVAAVQILIPELSAALFPSALSASPASSAPPEHGRQADT